MNKKLLIVRHAKSDWESGIKRDFDRPLNNRGEKNAPEMAQRLISKNIIPEKIVSSPALRAITTAGFFAEAFGYSKSDILQEPKIYEASASRLLKIINELPNEYNFIALFGHNPGLTELVINLSNADIYNLPTCGMVLLDFPYEDWSMISNGSGEKVFFDFPKNS
ncbi:MAG: Phosphohistidine phosphatase [Daejeonella sp.]|nr:Phosphohistidine phosphatase [Daejeonella sp.]